MKKFEFRLQRILEWRQTQAAIEELKLQRLHAERAELESRRASLAEDYGSSQKSLLREGPVTGTDLEALDHARKAAAAQVVRVDVALRSVEQRATVQMSTVTNKRREVRLLEQLRETKLQEWTRALAKEIDQQAQEAHLARWQSGETR